MGSAEMDSMIGEPPPSTFGLGEENLTIGAPSEIAIPASDPMSNMIGLDEKV